MPTVLLLLAIFLGPIPTLPAGVSLQEMLDFVMPATTEDVWFRHDGEQCAGLHRVIYTAYAKSHDATEVVVSLETRVIAGSPVCPNVAEAATVQDGVHGAPISPSTPPASKTKHGDVGQTFYSLSPNVNLEELWWTAPGSNSAPRLQLRPTQTPRERLFDARAPTFDMRQADADSDAPPALSVLRGVGDWRCDWYRQNAVDSNRLVHLTTFNVPCASVRISMAPSGKTVLVSWPGAPPTFKEFDLSRKTARDLPPPVGMKAGYATVGYDERGDRWVFSGDSNYVPGQRHPPETWTTYKWVGKAWKQMEQVAALSWPRDAFTSRRSMLARRINCQTLHKGPASLQYLGNNPTDLDRDACNNPTPMPMSSSRLSLLPPVEPRTRWAEMPAGKASVAGTQWCALGGEPEIRGPLVVLQDPNKVTELKDGLLPTRLAMRGPYLLLSTDSRRGLTWGRHTLMDLRSGKIVEVGGGNAQFVSFWPVVSGHTRKH